MEFHHSQTAEGRSGRTESRSGRTENRNSQAASRSGGRTAADIQRTDIVRSLAGHDKGRLFAVLETDGEYLLLADGKGRKIESPKRKKRRHTEFVVSPQSDTRLSRKIRGEGRLTNSELRRALAACRDEETRRGRVSDEESRQEG